MVNTVILDIDGTLVDTNYPHVEAWGRAPDEARAPVPMAVIREEIGKGSDKLLPDFVEGEEASQKASELHKKYYAETQESPSPLPGAKDLVSSLSERGYAAWFATSAEFLEAGFPEELAPSSWRVEGAANGRHGHAVARVLHHPRYATRTSVRGPDEGGGPARLRRPSGARHGHKRPNGTYTEGGQHMVTLKPIKEQVIVITGASSGIGLVTARMAAKRGARLVLAARNEEALDALVGEIRSGGGEAVRVAADVGSEEDVDRIAAGAFGGFDTWVNDAGISIFGGCMDVTIPDMRRMFETNFWGTVYGSRAAVRHFRRRFGDGDGRGGALINVGSVFGDRATPVQSTYSASKFALHGWTEALRMELEAANEPVSVTLVKPGRIDTPYNEHARSYIDKQPAHRGIVYPPEAVAEAILYCAEHPKRDIYVGLQSKAGSVLGRLAPRLTDKLMERHMFWSQRSADRPSKGREDNALYEPGYGLDERGTHEGHLRRTSLYTKASMHPALTAALAAAGLGLAAWGTVRARS